jgi:hypothetical protein
MSRGIVGPFETRKQGIAYPSLRGDIEKTAGLTVYELDEEVVDFARWRPFDQVSRSAVLAPAREDGGAGRRVAADTIALSSAGSGRNWPEKGGMKRTAMELLGGRSAISTTSLYVICSESILRHMAAMDANHDPRSNIVFG